MKTKHLALISLFLCLAASLGGCTASLASSWPGVTADANYAYIAGGPYVYAVNLQTGSQAWRFPDKASTAAPFYATPVLTSDGQLIVGGYDKKLYSLDPKTGKSTWQFTQARDRWIGGVLVVNETIYAPNADYQLYAFNLQGTLKWSFEADASIWGTPVSDGTNIYFGTLGRKVYAVNAQTGKQIWVQTMDGAVLGSPLIGSDQALYVGTYGGSLYALNITNGKTLWSKPVSSWIWSGPVLDSGNLYVGDANGNLYAFPAAGGAKLWVQKLSGSIIGSPFVSGNTLVVGTNVVGSNSGNVYFLDNTGKIIQTLPMSGKAQAYSTPLSAGSLILVPLTSTDVADPVLLALDPNGAIKWSFIPPK